MDLMSLRGHISSPGIFRFRSQALPTVATEAARWRRLMLSRIRPSPVTLTLNGLPVDRWEKNENAEGNQSIPSQSLQSAVLHLRAMHSITQDHRRAFHSTSCAWGINYGFCVKGQKNKKQRLTSIQFRRVITFKQRSLNYNVFSS